MNSLYTYLTDRFTSARRDLATLALTFGTIYFLFLGRFPLLEPDEGRYSEIPREMLERGDFITPLLNYVKYFEKPPLLYWINSLSFAIFGQNEFAARFPCALSGLLTILCTYWIGRQLFDRRCGLFAAIILGTSGGFFGQSRINITDMPLTLCLTLCLGAFILAVRDRGERKALYYYLFYAGAALAVLAKGLIGLLFPGAIIFLFLLIRKRWHILKEMRLLTGIPLFLLIAAPWFILVSLRNPEFARFFFIHEHFERFLTKVHGRYEPIWFFIPILLATMLPWSVYIPAAFREAWRRRRDQQGDALVWLALWALFIFLFFSKSNSKLVPYILPLFPPLALMIAQCFTTALDKGLAPLKGYTRTLMVFFSALVIALPAYALISKKNDLNLPIALLLSCCLIVLVIFIWNAQHKDDVPGLIVSLGAGMTIITLMATGLAYTHLAQEKTAKPLALKVRELAGPDAVVASFGYDQTLPFYAGRRTVVVGDMGELGFGSRQGDQSAWFIDSASFYRLWSSDRPVYVIMKKHEVEELSRISGKAPKVIMANQRKFLVTNR